MNEVLSKWKRLAVLAVLGISLPAFAEAPSSDSAAIRFGSDGLVASFLSGDGGGNLIDPKQPGDGFYMVTFDGVTTRKTKLSQVDLSGDSLVVSADQSYPRFTFELTRGRHYLGMKLKRVEGLPTDCNLSLHFQMKGLASLKAFSLDYMTQTDEKAGDVNVHWPFLWHRNPADPLGGVAFYASGTEAAEDESLIDIWTHEDIPRPAIADAWTADRARQWIKDYAIHTADLSTMTIAAANPQELYSLTDTAQKLGIKVIYLHTDTWRGEYWPIRQSHVHVNENVFPAGREDLAKYVAYLHSHGMRLVLHYVCAGIGPSDPVRITGHVDRELASWGQGTLAETAGKDDRVLHFRPAPDVQYPVVIGRDTNGPHQIRPWLNTNFVRIDEEIIRFNNVEGIDQPVWTLSGCQRGYGTTAAVEHAAGAETAGLVSAYGQVFVPDDDSPLLEQMAREYADFANAIGLDHLEYDGYEIHSQLPWGPRKFSDLVARHLDHPVTSSTSGGVPVASNIETRFSEVKRNKQFGYDSASLSLLLEGHRRATSPLDVSFEIPAGLAKGARRFQIIKPEPMFGVSTEMLRQHGLAQEMLDVFRMWKLAEPLLTADQLATIGGGMRRAESYTQLRQAGGHLEGKDIFMIQENATGYAITPARVMTRKQGDVYWRVGQEFGVVSPQQLVHPGETLQLENPFNPQPAGFIIHVLAETGETAVAPVKQDRSADAAIVDSYRTGADAAGKEAPQPTTMPRKPVPLQPLAVEIQNQKLATIQQDGDALLVSAENPRDEDRWIERGQPTWRRSFGMTSGHGMAMDVTGDGSGAILVLQLCGRGTRDYVVKIDFTGTRAIEIPSGESAWANGYWGWRFDAKYFDYKQVNELALGFGYLPPHSTPKVRVANIRQLIDRPSKIENPVITTGTGTLAVKGTVSTGQYLRYTAGQTATVYDANWNQVATLPVEASNYLMPAGFAPVRVDVPANSPSPWMEVQFITLGTPILVNKEGR